MPCACWRSEEHTSELQSPCNLVCRLLFEKKKTKHTSAVRFVLLHYGRDTRSRARCYLRIERRVRHYGFLVFLQRILLVLCFFFFNDTATTEIYTLSLHDALPISFSCWGNSPLWASLYLLTAGE